MRTNFLDEAAAITGGSYRIEDTPAARPCVYESGTFRLQVGDQTLVAEGLQETDQSAVLLIAAWVKAALVDDEKKRFSDAVNALFDPETAMEEALNRAYAVSLKDCPRIVFFVVCDRFLSDESQIDVLRETFADDPQDIFFIAHPYIFVIAKTANSIESAQDYALSVADTFMTEVMGRASVTYSAECTYLSQLRRGQFQAAKAYRALKLSGKDVNVMGFFDMGFAGIIADMDKTACQEFIYELYGQGALPQIDEELSRAAMTFIDNSLNISDTARALYLHRNTFIYHLDKFEKQTGLNLRKFSDAMKYQLLMLADRRLKELE